MTAFIALAKGELGIDTEKYLQNYGLIVRLDGRPLRYEQRIGSIKFRPMASKDVPWYVAEKADYGITGEDLLEDYNLGNGNKLKIVGMAGFGKADLVVFARDDLPGVKRNLRGKLKVVAPYFYSNLVTRGKAGEYMRENFGDYDVKFVSGFIEGFVARGDADIGFDLTSYFQQQADERERTTIASNGLKILENIMPTEAVVITRAESRSKIGDFKNMLRLTGKTEKLVITIGNMSEFEVIKYNDK